MNYWMGDHLGSIDFVFFSLTRIGRNIMQIRQICQILLINLNFRKTQMSGVQMFVQFAQR